MKRLFILMGLTLLITACDNDLEQFPPKQLESSSLDDYAGVLNAAYYYQTGSATPLAIMGDFRADNMLFEEEPYPSFDRFNSDLAGGDLVEQFFRPFYSNLYKSILSTNNVIDNSLDDSEVGEAKFLRALSYFKLVIAFGDVTINLSPSPDVSDPSILARQPAEEVYTNIIIPDLQDAISLLDNSGLSNDRASQIAAQALLGRVYMYRNDFVNAEQQLAAVINGAASAGLSLESNFADVITAGSSEIIFSTQFSTSVGDVYGFTEFPGWFSGSDTKALNPLDPDLIAAFDAVADQTLAGEDLRRALTIDEEELASVKYTGEHLEDDEESGGLEQDWIELRLSDIVLLYAEALNENGATPETVLDLLDPIRTRAGLMELDHNVINTKALVAQAIQDERRLELAFEGHRWFDLVRTGTVNQEIGETVDPNYYVFPIPNSEILASGGVITQNPGY